MFLRDFFVEFAVRGKPCYKVNVVPVKVSDIILTKVTCIHDGVVNRYLVLPEFGDCCAQSAHINNVAGTVPEIDRHTVTAVNDIDQANLQVNLSVVAADLRNRHF